MVPGLCRSFCKQGGRRKSHTGIRVKGCRPQEIEKGRLRDDGVLQINGMTAEVAAKHGIELLDLQGVFEKDYAENGRPFEFVHDGHWNAYAHELVAKHLARLIRNRVLPPADK